MLVESLIQSRWTEAASALATVVLKMKGLQLSRAKRIERENLQLGSELAIDENMIRTYRYRVKVGASPSAGKTQLQVVTTTECETGTKVTFVIWSLSLKYSFDLLQQSFSSYLC